MSDHSLTVLVTRVIKPGCGQSFEQTMREFVDVAKTFHGHLGMQMLRPAEDDRAGEYTVIVRFDSLAARRVFTASPAYRDFMTRLGAQSVGEPVIRELSDVEGWAALSDAPGNPPRWKMAITVWFGVTSLSQIFALLFTPFIGDWPRHLQMLATSTATVVVLTWVVLPPLMRALQGWYFPGGRR